MLKHRQEQVDPRDESDSAYRHAWGRDGKAPFGRPLRAAFYQYLPEAPKHTRPNIDAYFDYVRQIDDTIERGCWSNREITRLNVLRKIWDRRARGLDMRYKTCGNVRGQGRGEKAAAHQPGSARTCIEAIYARIAESGAGQVVGRPTQAFLVDPKWPLGRPNPDWRG